MYLKQSRLMVNLARADHYSQRNNRLDPGVACASTSHPMFLRGNKVPFVNPSTFQDDDFFRDLLSTESAQAVRDAKYPSLSSYHPGEIHGMYHTFLEPLVCGRRVSDFRTDLTWDDYVRIMLSGQVAWTSGAFPEAGIDGHAFAVIGYEAGALVLADPWGDYRTKYRVHSGYGVAMSRADFVEHVHPAGESRKWGHVLI